MAPRTQGDIPATWNPCHTLRHPDHMAPRTQVVAFQPHRRLPPLPCRQTRPSPALSCLACPFLSAAPRHGTPDPARHPGIQPPCPPRLAADPLVQAVPKNPTPVSTDPSLWLAFPNLAWPHLFWPRDAWLCRAETSRLHVSKMREMSIRNTQHTGE